MATAAQLRAQMNNLRKQLDEANRRCDDVRGRIERETAEQLKAVSRKYEKALNEQNNRTRAEYARKFREAQEEMLAFQKEKNRQLEAEVAAYNRQQKQILSQIEDIQKKLDYELEKLRKRSSQENDASRELAENACKEMLTSQKEAAAHPHSFFLPNQYDTVMLQASKVRADIENGMFQSAIADANAAAMQYDIISVKTQASLRDWYRAYSEFKSIVSQLDLQIKSFLETLVCGAVMTEDECDFWSKGTFSMIKKEIDKAKQSLQKIDEQGAVSYLKSVKNPNRQAIFSAVTQAKLWQVQLTAVLGCILQEKVKSYERFELGNFIAERLEDDAYKIGKCKFREADEKDRCQQWYIMPSDENPFEAFEVTASFDGKDILHVDIVPVREQGIVIRNECIVFVELKSIQSEVYELHYLAEMEKRIKSCLGREIKVRAQGFLSDEAVKNMSSSAPEAVHRFEKMMKKTPDVNKQIQLMERKYNI